MSEEKEDQVKVFHSVEQLKVELFPDMAEDVSPDGIDKSESDEANQLAEQLIETLMRTVKKKEDS